MSYSIYVSGQAELGLAPEAVDYLWHYTSQPAYVQIIRSRELHATDTRFLNDAKEIFHGQDLISERLSTAAGFDFVAAFNTIKTHSYVAPHAREYPVYVISFCMDRGDRLSQWRGYGGSSTHGVALGLEFSDFERQVRESGGRLVEVVYDPGDQSELVAQRVDLLSELVAPIKRIQHDGRTEDPRHYLSDPTYRKHFDDLMFEVTATAAQLKDPGFQEEHEWRAIFSGASNSQSNPAALGLGFRPGQYGVTPYVRVPVDWSALRAVRIGPNMTMDLAIQGARTFHADAGLSAQVWPSTIHYRQ